MRRPDASAISDGTLLLCTGGPPDTSGTMAKGSNLPAAKILRSGADPAVVGEVAPAAMVVAQGAPFDVKGCLMVPISLHGLVELRWFERPPSRRELISRIFYACDIDEDGRLNRMELYRLALCLDFPGTAADWAVEFQTLCWEYGVDPALGFDEHSFLCCLNDAGSCYYCADEALSSIAGMLPQARNLQGYSRAGLVSDLFRTADLDGDGRLDQRELGRVVRSVGYLGDAVAWTKEYMTLCSTLCAGYGADGRGGMDLGAFRRLVSDGRCAYHCSDQQLVAICWDLGMARRRVQAQPPQLQPQQPPSPAKAPQRQPPSPAGSRLLPPEPEEEVAAVCRCGNVLVVGMLFCPACGTPVAARPASVEHVACQGPGPDGGRCGAPLAEGMEFCARCGTPRPSTPRASTPRGSPAPGDAPKAGAADEDAGPPPLASSTRPRPPPAPAAAPEAPPPLVPAAPVAKQPPPVATGTASGRQPGVKPQEQPLDQTGKTEPEVERSPVPKPKPAPKAKGAAAPPKSAAAAKKKPAAAATKKAGPPVPKGWSLNPFTKKKRQAEAQKLAKEWAATKIQAGFRGKQARTQVKGMREEREAATHKAAQEAERNAEAARKEEVRKQDFSKHQSKGAQRREAVAAKAGAKAVPKARRRSSQLRREEEAAATKIQSMQRGKKVRQEVMARRQAAVKQEDDREALQNKAGGVKEGTVLVCNCHDEDNQAEVFVSPDSVDVAGMVHLGERVVASGLPVEIAGFVMVPVKKPKGFIELDLFEQLDPAPVASGTTLLCTWQGAGGASVYDAPEAAAQGGAGGKAVASIPRGNHVTAAGPVVSATPPGGGAALTLVPLLPEGYADMAFFAPVLAEVGGF